MSVEGLRNLSEELKIDYTDFVNYRVKFWGKNKGLDLSYLGLNNLPDHLYSVSDIRVLNLSGNNLKNLHGADQIILENLRTLRIDGNPFVNFPDEIIELNTIRELYMDACEIKKVPEQVFHLKELKTLSLQQNNLDCLPDLSDVPNSSLQILHLDRNALDQIQLNHDPFHKLEILKISHNLIENFPNNRLNPKLWMMDFQGNPISKIDPDNFHEEPIKSLSFDLLNSDILNTELIRKLLKINQTIIGLTSSEDFKLVENRIQRLARVAGVQKITFYHPARNEMMISNLKDQRFY